MHFKEIAQSMVERNAAICQVTSGSDLNETVEG